LQRSVVSEFVAASLASVSVGKLISLDPGLEL
jgi:hypothetical protein